MVISVVIPNYNTGLYLEACIQSIIDQNYASTEIIIVDGKSTDNSIDIINKYASHFAKIIIEKDSGQAEAINKGFAVSTGEIMCWLNADDMFRPNALRNVAALFSSFEQVAWITGRKTIINESGDIIQDGDASNLTLGQVLAGAYRWIQQESTFWRRRLWDAVGGRLDENYTLAVDLELWLRMFQHDRLYPVNKNLGAFRLREGQRSKTQASKYHEEATKAIHSARNRASDSYRKFCRDAILSENFNTTQKEVLTNWPHLRDESVKTIPFSEESGKFQNPNPNRLHPNTLNRVHKCSTIIRNSVVSNGPECRNIDVGQEIADFLLIPRNSTCGDDISAFKDSHLGERCWIMGNGPSLNEMDLSLLANETVFCSNGAYLLFNRISWLPKYHICVDTRVLPDTADEIANILRTNRSITGFYPSELAIYDGTGRTLDTRLLLPTLPNAFYFRLRNMEASKLPDSAFYLDANKCVCTPNTVTVAMMQIASYMGFAEIYLIGCDTSYKVLDTVAQDGPEVQASDGQRLFLTSTKDDDCNHFDPAYFGKGRKWHNPKVDDMVKHYTYAKQVLDEVGIRVFNATVGGNLEVFERVDYRKVLAKNE